MKWLELISERWFQKNRDKAIPMVVLFIFLSLGSIYALFNLSQNLRWLGWLALVGSLFCVFISLVIYKSVKFKDQKPDRISVVKEYLLTFLMFGLLAFNVIGGYASYLHNLSQPGVLVLWLSIFVLGFKAWKFRFLFLVLLLFLGVSLIELQVDL